MSDYIGVVLGLVVIVAYWLGIIGLIAMGINYLFS